MAASTPSDVAGHGHDPDDFQNRDINHRAPPLTVRAECNDVRRSSPPAHELSIALVGKDNELHVRATIRDVPIRKILQELIGQCSTLNHVVGECLM